MAKKEKKSIVLLDDDTEFAQTLGEILELEGFSVRIETSLRFVSAFEQNPPDLFLVDAWFDDTLNSKNFILALNQNKKLKETPVFLISSDETMIDLKKRGQVDEFFEKPVKIDALLEQLEQI